MLYQLPTSRLLHFYQVLALVALSLCALVSHAETIHFDAESGPNKVAVMEFFTSQGCSSCPAKERWMGQLGEHGVTTEQLVSLGFHTNYWASMGLSDPVAKDQFETRHRTLATTLDKKVYTPQIFMAGRVFEDEDEFFTALNEINQQKEMAHLMATGHYDDAENTVHMTINATKNPYMNDQVVVYVAVVEKAVTTNIQSGKYEGKTVHYHNVVRYLSDAIAMQPTLSAHPYQIKLPKALSDEFMVVVFAQSLDTTRVLQALPIELKAR